MRELIMIFLCSAFLAGCASKVSTTGTDAAGNYSEDLSVWRPAAEIKKDSAEAAINGSKRTRTNQYVEARHSVVAQIDNVLDSIYNDNLSKGTIDGYTIQVYSGIKREDALNVKKRLTQSLPDLGSDVQYRQPNFRVRTGKYLSRLDAQKDYLAVKRFFPNAIVIPDRIELQ